MGGVAAAEHPDPDMPVPAELCGPVWPGEFSALERVGLGSENQSLLLGGILGGVMEQRDKGVRDQKVWT